MPRIRKSKPINRHARLAKLNSCIRECQVCPGLNIPGKTEGAPGYGKINARVMLVGQSLHAYNPETPKRQIPFVGYSGRPHSGTILFEAIEKAGYSYKNLFTTNAIHCHPPGNRPNEASEVENCQPFLIQEILIVQPKLIIGLGLQAREALAKAGLKMATKQGLTKLTAHKDYGFSVWSTYLYHPAYFLRSPNPNKQAEWEKRLKELLDYGHTP